VCGDAYVNGDLLAVELLLHALHGLLGLGFVGFGEEEGEFVAADPGGIVAGSFVLLQGLGELLEALVAGGVPVLVVCCFEVLYIDEDEAEGALVALGGGVKLLKCFVESAAVEESGERVGLVLL